MSMARLDAFDLPRGRFPEIGSSRIRRKWWSLAASAVLATLALQAGPVAAADDVVIGALLPMTGGNAPNGAQKKAGYEIAIEEVNAQGGIAALGGAKMKLVVRDHEGKPDVGARLANAIINDDKVSVVVGTYQSGVSIPVARVTERLKTPFLVTDSMADEITEGGLKYLFRIDTKAELATRGMLEGVKAFGVKLGTPITKIALLNEDSAFGQSLKADFEKQAPLLGLTVVENLSFKAGSPDLSAQAARIKASGAEWTVGSWYITDMLTIVRTFPGQGLNIARVSTFGGGVQTPALLQAGEQAEGVTGFTMWNPDLNRPGVKAFAEKFRQRLGVEPNQNAVEVLCRRLDPQGSHRARRLAGQGQAARYPGQDRDHFRPGDDHAHEQDLVRRHRAAAPDAYRYPGPEGGLPDRLAG